MNASEFTVKDMRQEPQLKGNVLGSFQADDIILEAGRGKKKLPSEITVFPQRNNQNNLIVFMMSNLT